MVENKVIKVCNPYFRRDFEQKNGEVIFKDTGVWVECWSERQRKGLFMKTIQRQEKFETKEEAIDFMYKLLAKFCK